MLFLLAVVGGILIGQFVASRREAWGWSDEEGIIVVVMACILWGAVVNILAL